MSLPTNTEVLTHRGLNKMADISRRNFQMQFLDKNDFILIQITQNCVHNGLVDNKSAFEYGTGLAPNREATSWTSVEC